MISSHVPYSFYRFATSRYTANEKYVTRFPEVVLYEFYGGKFFSKTLVPIRKMRTHVNVLILINDTRFAIRVKRRNRTIAIKNIFCWTATTAWKRKANLDA